MPADRQEALLEALQSANPDDIAIVRREQVLLAYADKLTGDPAAVTSADITSLRDVGLDDRAIHDACAIIAYFAFVNRIADGLGVELEDSNPA